MRGRSYGRERAAAQGPTPSGGASPCRRGDRQRCRHLPLFRHQPADVLQAATATRSWDQKGSETGRRARTTAPRSPTQKWSPRSCICASTITSAAEDRHVPQALPRHRDFQLWGVEDPRPPGQGRLPANQRYKRHKQRWKRYKKPQPGHQMQIDVKFITPIAGVKKKKGTYIPN